MIYTLEQVVAAGKKKYPWAEYSDEAWDEWGAAELEKRAQKKAAKEAAAALPEVVEFGPPVAPSWEGVCAEPSLGGLSLSGKQYVFDFPFKKVVGQTLGWVLENDPSYLDWLCQKVRLPAHIRVSLRTRVRRPARAARTCSCA